LVASEWNVSWHHTKLGIPDLWTSNIRGAGVKVAVLDTGLAAPTGLDRTGFEHLDARGASMAPSDLDGHGTSCASVIASYRGGAMGIAPFAEIVSLRVLGTGTSTTDIDSALTFVSKRPDIDVVSCSLVMSQITPSIVDTLAKLVQAGKVVVAAAGDAHSVHSPFPEDVRGVITVAAVDERDQPLVGARTGPWIDVAACGKDIPVVLRNSDATGLFGESSAAAAVVSGVIALVLSTQEAPARQRVGKLMKSLLQTTSTPIDDPTGGSGHGLVNPKKLVERAKTSI
jgi:subtilisin family serine protease